MLSVFLRFPEYVPRSLLLLLLLVVLLPFSWRAWSMAVRCAMLSSCDFQTMLVSFRCLVVNDIYHMMIVVVEVDGQKIMMKVVMIK